MASVSQKLYLYRETETLDATFTLKLDNVSSEECESLLHPKEIKQRSAISNVKRLRSYCLGKWVAKHALTGFFNGAIKPQDFYIKKGVFEQPVVYCPDMSNVQVSVTHSSCYGAAIAFPETHPMGIDLECLSELNPEAIKKKCTEAELALFHDYFGDEKVATGFLWTAKEALSKSIKTGLLIDFKFMELTSVEKLKGGIYEMYFKSFGQYKILGFKANDILLSLALPYKTKLDLRPLKEAIKAVS